MIDAETGDPVWKRGFPPGPGQPGDYDEYITMPAFGDGTMVIGGFKNVYGLSVPE